MTPDTPATFRFAPSPNGELHLGHAYSALFTQHFARSERARLLLRLEDIDTLRCPNRFCQQAVEDLDWLGFHWDGPVLRQSEHFHRYRAAIDRLDDLGVLYACVCSRTEIVARAGPMPPLDPDGVPIYPGTCRHKPLDRRELARRHVRYALRLDMAAALALLDRRLTFLELGLGPGDETGVLETTPERWGDVVLARRDIGTSYHIAVVTDDALQGVTCVTRGQDLFCATSIHRLLQALLALPEPAYRHHKLLRAGDGHKLSKSLGAKSLRTWRESGASADDIRRIVGL
ncbi:MAG: tRNA glutamyl-Q(34) synthetase GluQRS [Hyphomicrobiales bacterium]